MDEPLQSQSYEPISQKILETTLKKIKRAVKGNGVDIDAVKIKSHDGIIHVFNTKTLLQIKAVLAKRTEPGRNTIATPLASEAEINLKAATRINNAVTNEGTRDAIIKSYVNKDPSKGFTAKTVRLPLESLKHDYVLHQDCPTCQKQGKIQCRQCNATGKKICDICHGSNRMPCHHCNGQRFIHGTNGKQNCPHCNAIGTLNCIKCHGKGTMSCTYCKAQGYSPCTKCASSGVFSVINHFEAEAQSLFKCDEQAKLPKEISDYLKNEKTRRNLTLHAKIVPLRVKDDDLSNQHTTQTQAKNAEHSASKQTKQKDLITIPFQVRCPYADIVIEVNGEEYSGKILGFRPKFTEFDPFIEILAKKGMDKLKKALKDKKNSRENLEKATEFAIIKEILSLTIRNSNANTLRQLKKIYPLGVRDSQLKAMMQQTRRAMKNITLLPRIAAMSIGLLISLTLYFIYLFYNGDSLIPETLKQSNALLGHAATTVLQVSPLIITFVLTSYLAKIKIRRSMRDILSAADLSVIKTNLGHIGLAIPVLYITGAALICEFATKSENLPLWFTMLRQAILP
tara:strand:+ start:2168 stop:3871 length:1704 start_codon:yes stop_codon:yes gene_type:complete